MTRKEKNLELLRIALAELISDSNPLKQYKAGLCLSENMFGFSRDDDSAFPSFSAGVSPEGLWFFHCFAFESDGLPWEEREEIMSSFIKTMFRDARKNELRWK